MSSDLNNVRFELKVEGMTCIKCAHKLEKTLLNHDPPAQNLRVDYIASKAIFSLATKNELQQIIDAIHAISFQVTKITDVTQSNDGRRILRLKISKGDGSSIVQAIFPHLPGIKEEPTVLNNTVTISYNPVAIRGTSIINKIKELPEYINEVLSFQIENPFQDDEEQSFSGYTGWQVIISLFCMFSIIGSLLLPGVDMTYPSSWGIASYYMIFIVIMTIIVVVVVGFSIFKTCIKQILAGFHASMITFISVGSGLALIFGSIYFVIGLVNTINDDLSNIEYYINNAAQNLQTSGAIFTSVVAGQYIQGVIKKRIAKRIAEIRSSMKVKVNTVQRITPNDALFTSYIKEDIYPALIERGDFVLIHAGMLPFDGFIEKGALKLIENVQFGMETIEPKAVGSRVMSGSQVISMDGEVIMRVTEPLEQTLAGKLFMEIKEAASGTAIDGKMNDSLMKFTSYFITTIFVIAGLTFLFWMSVLIFDFFDFPINFTYPFERTIALLIASCPCALGTAIPMMYAIALRRALNTGVLIKDPSSLDILNKIDTVVFDKTGTITGNFNLENQKSLDQEFDEPTIWKLISVVERDHITHPVGLALYQEALKQLSKSRSKPKFEVIKTKFDHKYHGAEGISDDSIEINGKKRKIMIGNLKMLKRLRIADQIGEENPPEGDDNDDDCHDKKIVIPPPSLLTTECNKQKSCSETATGCKEKNKETCNKEKEAITCTKSQTDHEKKSCCSTKTEKTCCETTKKGQCEDQPKKDSCCGEKGSKKQCCGEKKDASKSPCCQNKEKDTNATTPSQTCCNKKETIDFNQEIGTPIEKKPCCSKTKEIQPEEEEEKKESTCTKKKDNCCSNTQEGCSKTQNKSCCTKNESPVTPQQKTCCTQNDLQKQPCCKKEKQDADEEILFTNTQPKSDCCTKDITLSEKKPCCAQTGGKCCEEKAEKKACCENKTEKKGCCEQSEKKGCCENKTEKKECCEQGEKKPCCAEKQEIKSCCVNNEGKKCCDGGPKTEQKGCCAGNAKKACCNEKEKRIPTRSQHLTLYVIVDQRVIFQITLNLEESLKENVNELILGLKSKQKEIHLLTGDSRAAAISTANILKIHEKNVKAEVTPNEKEDYIKSLIEEREKNVLMIGDGINDIKAFQEATLSCTINFKSAQNLTFSDLVIIDNDVENIMALFNLAPAVDITKKIILFVSVVYNIPIILAASGATMFVFDFDLPVFMAAWAMFLSDIVLVLLSNLVECVRLKPQSNRLTEGKTTKPKVRNQGDVYIRMDDEDNE